MSASTHGRVCVASGVGGGGDFEPAVVYQVEWGSEVLDLVVDGEGGAVAGGFAETVGIPSVGAEHNVGRYGWAEGSVGQSDPASALRVPATQLREDSSTTGCTLTIHNKSSPLII